MTSIRVLHANWTGRTLWFWGEDSGKAAAQAFVGAGAALMEEDQEDAGEAPPPPPPATPEGVGHPFSLSRGELVGALHELGVEVGSSPDGALRLALPTRDGRPLPSPRVAHAAGYGGFEVEADLDTTVDVWSLEAVGLGAPEAPAALERLEAAANGDPDNGRPRHVLLGPSVRYLAAAARLARALVAEQRVTPMAMQEQSGAIHGMWTPWFGDEATAERVGRLLRAMPPSVRAVQDDFEHEAWPVLQDFLDCVADALCRRALIEDEMFEAIEERDPGSDLHVAWLGGLLGEGEEAPVHGARRSMLMRGVRDWIGSLDERGADVRWKLLLRLNEPLQLGKTEDLAAPGDDVVWVVTFHLQPVDDEEILIDAEEIWSSQADAMNVHGRALESPKELLLAELARASRLFPRLEASLSEDAPCEITIGTKEAYEFLREIRPLLREQGFGVQTPEWWESPSARVGARLIVDSESMAESEEGGDAGQATGDARFGLDTLVDYRWRIAVGDRALSMKEFEQLASQDSPLVQVEGQWVEIRPEDVQAAMEFISRNPGGKIRAADALRLAYASDAEQTGVPVLGMEASGWVASLFGEAEREQQLPKIEQPEGFIGGLRPYQLKGVSWLSFLDRMGLGACLADDMGLGKTIQLLALLQYEREQAGAAGQDPSQLGPTLVVAPMSVVGNWRREAARFTPAIRSMVHHGVERLSGDSFVDAAHESDLVVTTYALAHRDRDDLGRIRWRRVALDEAQNIKNPSAKQTRALRGLDAPRRVALTGTPVENRLSELWSIMEFCNPGYLGGPAEFRRRFSVPIERRHDKSRGEQLRQLVRPFVLRRLKTDPKVTADLPEKVESREFCPLSPEQASMYEKAVHTMLGEVDRAEGMQRRGVVLSTLIKLKQICNHPAQALKEGAADVDPARSGKTIRLLEMLEEAVAAGDQALVFTQFRQMGQILAPLIAGRLDRDVLFLHGGTPQKAREQMVERFQRADGSAPVFILSLRAGGLGMNLTAASHVFHFDRWWNPAVENQATDRAHRIGQTRTVQVHKFVVEGTLEERIDEMLDQKTELAERIITSGEQWLTELSTGQLRDLLSLRGGVVEETIGEEQA